MLENKLGIDNSSELAREEERISKRKAMELWENGIFDNLEAGKFSTLQLIHKYLFEDIYEFAGKIRTVNLAKGNFRFAPVMYLEAALANIDQMPQSNFDEIVEKYVEMNIAHPFRDDDVIIRTKLRKPNKIKGLHDLVLIFLCSGRRSSTILFLAFCLKAIQILLANNMQKSVCFFLRKQLKQPNHPKDGLEGPKSL